MGYDRLHDLAGSYAQSDELDPGEHDQFAAADMALTKNLAFYVNAEYPGHPWYIEVSHFKKIVRMNIPLLMGQWFHIVPIANLHTDPGFKQVLRGLGEILERFRIPRCGYSHADFLAAEERNPIRKVRSQNFILPT